MIKKLTIDFIFDTDERTLKFISKCECPEYAQFTNAEILGFIEMYKHQVLNAEEAIFKIQNETNE